MDVLDSTSLAKVTEKVNHAHFFGDKIDKTEAEKAITWITSRYGRVLPASVQAQANPDPRWAAVPPIFHLTETDLKSPVHTFTGEPLKNASMRMIHSREAARALLILSEVTGTPVPEAKEHCVGTGYVANSCADRGLALFCCGPCTASVLRLANFGALGDCEKAIDHLLSALPGHRDDKGTWRRFPFFFTLLALIELDRPAATEELKYAQPVCERKRKRLKPKDDISLRRIAVLDRALAA
jgi:hypothetical protein